MSRADCPDAPPTRTSPPTLAWALALVLFALGSSLLAWRGPARALAPGGSSDFSLIWQSARTWSEGASPYSLADTRRVWAERSGSAQDPPSEANQALLVYPPSTFVLMSPCVLADWRTSMSLWAATNTVLLAGAIVLVLGLAGLSHRRPIWWGAAGLMLAAAPGHTAISVGQPAVLVTFLIVLAHAIRAARARSSPGVQVRASPVDRGSNRAGILLGLAAALKPQIGVFFVAYEFARGRWRSGIAAGLTIAVVLGVGVWQLHRHSIDWLPAWRSNLDAFALTDNANPALTNPLRYQLINLHVWFGAFVSDTTTLKGLVYAACAALALAYALASRKPRTTAHDLLDLAFVGVISLLVVYHRAYDATILLLGAGLFARELTGVTACLNARAPVALLGLFLLPSLLPGASALVAFARPGGPLEGAAQTAWWNALVVPHLTVALVALAATLIVLRARSEPALTPP